MSYRQFGATQQQLTQRNTRQQRLNENNNFQCPTPQHQQHQSQHGANQFLSSTSTALTQRKLTTSVLSQNQTVHPLSARNMNQLSSTNVLYNQQTKITQASTGMANHNSQSNNTHQPSRVSPLAGTRSRPNLNVTQTLKGTYPQFNKGEKNLEKQKMGVVGDGTEHSFSPTLKLPQQHQQQFKDNQTKKDFSPVRKQDVSAQRSAREVSQGTQPNQQQVKTPIRQPVLTDTTTIQNQNDLTNGNQNSKVPQNGLNFNSQQPDKDNKDEDPQNLLNSISKSLFSNQSRQNSKPKKPQEQAKPPFQVNQQQWLNNLFSAASAQQAMIQQMQQPANAAQCQCDWQNEKDQYVSKVEIFDIIKQMYLFFENQQSTFTQRIQSLETQLGYKWAKTPTKKDQDSVNEIEVSPVKIMNSRSPKRRTNNNIQSKPRVASPQKFHQQQHQQPEESPLKELELSSFIDYSGKNEGQYADITVGETPQPNNPLHLKQEREPTCKPEQFKTTVTTTTKQKQAFQQKPKMLSVYKPAVQDNSKNHTVSANNNGDLSNLFSQLNVQELQVEPAQIPQIEIEASLETINTHSIVKEGDSKIEKKSGDQKSYIASLLSNLDGLTAAGLEHLMCDKDKTDTKSPSKSRSPQKQLQQQASSQKQQLKKDRSESSNSRIGKGYFKPATEQQKQSTKNLTGKIMQKQPQPDLSNKNNLPTNQRNQYKFVQNQILGGKPLNKTATATSTTTSNKAESVQLSGSTTDRRVHNFKSMAPSFSQSVLGLKKPGQKSLATTKFLENTASKLKLDHAVTPEDHSDPGHFFMTQQSSARKPYQRQNQQISDIDSSPASKMTPVQPRQLFAQNFSKLTKQNLNLPFQDRFNQFKQQNTNASNNATAGGGPGSGGLSRNQEKSKSLVRFESLQVNQTSDQADQNMRRTASEQKLSKI